VIVDITVHNAEYSVLNDQQIYVLSVEIDAHDGRPPRFMAHVMPADIFEWRAAEYEIDLSTDSGWDDVMHIVMYENQVTPDADVLLADPDHLLNAPTVAHARKARLAFIKEKRARGKLRGVAGPPTFHQAILDNATRLATSGDETDPLQFIRDTAPVSEDHMRVKREYNRRRRNVIRARRQGRNIVEMTEVNDQVKRDMKMGHRESARELSDRLLRPEPRQDGSGIVGQPPRIVRGR
jgi:hypothetical protein